MTFHREGLHDVMSAIGLSGHGTAQMRNIRAPEGVRGPIVIMASR